ncbi:MAG: beta-propeller domain-containing protein [Myxococcales bacterium]|nr:beta-propeller domain-containing protein [Myxococcales bacterium]
MHRSLALISCLTLASLIGCAFETRGVIEEPTPPDVVLSLASLQPADGCDDVEAALREQAIEEMEQRLSDNEQLLLDSLSGGHWCYEDVAYADGSGPPVPSGAREDGASDYSTTNTQVAGVDEADFVKNDSQYIYVLADGHFTIIDAWPAAEAHVVSSVPIEGEPKKLYVHENRAVIYSSLDPLEVPDDPGLWWGGGFAPIPGGYYDPSECTYGYDCDFRGDGRGLLVTIFDIEDKSSPKVRRESELNGSYLNSRRVDDVVYTAITFPEVTLPGVTYWPEGLLEDFRYSCEPLNLDEGEIRVAFALLKAVNRALIEESTIHDYLPSIRDTRYVDGDRIAEDGLLNGCEGFYLSNARDGRQFLSLLSFDMTELDALNATTIVGRPGAVYANEQSLYVAVRHDHWTMPVWYFDDPEQRPEATTVHKFRLYPGSIATDYRGSGVVKGRILNQFAMDEHAKHLRIATTTGHLPSPDVHSTMSVLRDAAGELVVVGEVDGIAPTEDIRSVRFDGDVGFIVTFKKTDPLFVFDLSEANAPKIRGELKIPGFSTYMHLMDDNHLLTIGYDADDQGSFAWFQGVQLQIIDVADLEDPRLIHKEVIGTRGSTSEATTNHLAFNYFGSRDLLAIPMTICEGSGSGGGYAHEMTFSGLLVYNVTTGDGFDLLGGVPHAAPQSGPDYWSACGNWWTNSNSLVQRSIFMESYVYSIAPDKINVAHIDDPAAVLVSINLTSE